jgi:Zn-finger nucleic acid-binding protein
MRNLEYVICPKCQNVLQTVNRAGIQLEQCQGCRGIFLDHGELEQLISAEERHYAAAAPAYQPGPPPQYQQPQQPQHYQQPRYDDSPPPYGGHQQRYPDSPPSYGHGGKKRRGSFLGDLFD